MINWAHTDFLSDLFDLSPGGRAAPATLGLFRLTYVQRLSPGPFPLVDRNYLFPRMCFQPGGQWSPRIFYELHPPNDHRRRLRAS